MEEKKQNSKKNEDFMKSIFGIAEDVAKGVNFQDLLTSGSKFGDLIKSQSDMVDVIVNGYEDELKALTKDIIKKSTEIKNLDKKVGYLEAEKENFQEDYEQLSKNLEELKEELDKLKEKAKDEKKKSSGKVSE